MEDDGRFDEPLGIITPNEAPTDPRRHPQAAGQQPDGTFPDIVERLDDHLIGGGSRDGLQPYTTCISTSTGAPDPEAPPKSVTNGTAPTSSWIGPSDNTREKA